MTTPDRVAARSEYAGQRAAALGERTAMPALSELTEGSDRKADAARSLSFDANWRHAPVQVGGKERTQLDGYASVVGVEYEMYDMFGPFGETIAPEAFDETLAADPDVAFLVNHRGLTMARTVNKTLTLEADPRGLHSLAYVNQERSDVHDLVTAIDDGEITEMSFAFWLEEGEWDEDYEHFTITKVNIDRGDVSAVNYGANPYTSIGARSTEIMTDLMRMPAGAQRAAYARLAARFGEAHVAAAAVVGGQPVLADRDPVAAAEDGRSVGFYEAMLSL